MDEQDAHQERIKKRLVWRARRGTKELDLILSAFIHHHYADLTTAEQSCFARLLETPDPQLNDWLYNGITPPEQGMTNIVKRILSTHHP